ncbi:MAG: hypothetical protein ACYTE0_13170 [Planctomycetota bacterium]
MKKRLPLHTGDIAHEQAIVTFQSIVTFCTVGAYRRMQYFQERHV